MNSFLEKLKKRSKTDYLVFILLGVLVMIVAFPTEKKKETENTEDSQQTAKEEETDTEKMEEQLAALISRMEGAGKTRVMITLEDEGYMQVDKNLSIDEKKREEETVVYDSGDKETPYVVRRESPRVKGVVVVAEGGDNPGVVSAISNAVMSLFDIEAHRVIVVKMSVQEE